MASVDSGVVEALRRSELQHRLLLETLPNGVQRNDCEGVITYSNPAHHSILGMAPGELLGKRIWDFAPSAEGREVMKSYLATLVKEQPTPAPYMAEARRTDGTLVDLQIDWIYEHDNQGVLCGFISVITDITDRKRSEKELRQRTEGLTALLEVTQSLAKTLESEAVLQAAADGVTKLIGLDTAAIYLLQEDHLYLGVTTPPLPPDFSAEFRSAYLEDHPHIRRAVTSREPVLLFDMPAIDLTPAERTVADQRGLRTVLFLPMIADAEVMGVFIVGSTLEPVNLSSELINLSRTLASLSALALRNAQLYRDGQHHATQLEQSLVERMRAETERKTLEAQLIQAQKMESVGRLAGGVALDFNNMLAVILGHASLAVETLQAGHPLHGHLTQILTAAERSSDLTRQLLAFARKQTIDPKVLNLNEVIGNMLQMLRRLIGEDIHLSRLPDPDLGFVQLDPAQVDQILANLCVNARDAISGIGKVTIETANSRFDRTYCDEHPGFRPGNYVMIAVSDDGAGMDEETQAMIFEPFFTTKEAGKGTGLGLATVYGIAKQNKGFVNVYSEPGHGTTIRIYLPRQEETSEYEQIERNGQDLEGGNETVLLVEDEDMVLRLGKEMLESLGYSVLAAHSPEHALEIASKHHDAIDLLVTDVVMPGMNGRELSVRLENCCPNLRTLFISGYTANVIAEHGILSEGVKLLSKPFSKQQLASKVREAISVEDPGGSS